MHRADPDHIKQLVADARKGNREAFGALYDELMDRVYRFVRLRVGRREDAEDITEAVFVRAFGSIRRFEDRGLPFESWIFTIARNALTDHYRTHKQTAPLAEAEHMTDPADSPETTTERALQHEDLLSTMEKLPQSYREILLLIFVEERTTKEIAGIMGKPPDQIRVLKQRALDKLRRLVQ